MAIHTNVSRSVVVEPSGVVRLVELAAEPSALQAFYRELSCELVDAVTLSGDELVMWVDDEGLFRQPVVNLYATMVAREHGLTHQPYVGRALFCASTPDGDAVDLPPAALVHLLGLLAAAGADAGAAAAEVLAVEAVADHG